MNVIFGGDVNTELDDSNPVSTLFRRFAVSNGLK